MEERQTTEDALEQIWYTFIKWSECDLIISGKDKLYDHFITFVSCIKKKLYCWSHPIFKIEVIVGIIY